MKKTILCLLLALGLLLMSAAAMAASDPDQYLFDIGEGNITIEKGTEAGTLKVLYGNESKVDNISSDTTINVWGIRPLNSPKLIINATVPVKINYYVACQGDSWQSSISIADNADVTLTVAQDRCEVYGTSGRSGIELGSGSKLTINADGSTQRLYIYGGPSAILGPTDNSKPAATVILNSGNVYIHRQSGSGISGNVNLVINGSDFFARGKDINVQSLIVTGGELWAGDSADTKVTYENLRSHSNIHCTAGILPDNVDAYDHLTFFGDLTLPVDLTITKDSSFATDAKLTIPTGRSMTFSWDLSVSFKSNIITNNGTLTLNASNAFYGELVNNGTLYINSYVDMSNDMNTGTLTNTGTISGSGSIAPESSRLTQSKPTSLTVKRIENGAVTLEADGDGKTALEYSKDGTTWQDSPTFTGVDLSEGRTFSARYKADGQFYQASAPADVSIYPMTLHLTADSRKMDYYIAGQGATLPTNVTRTGYTFAGWYDNEALTGSPVTAIGTDETDHREFWAGWIAAPVITSPAEDTTVTVYEGEQATMTIAAKNAAAYQWFMSTDGGASWTECGTNSPTYTTSPTKLENNGYQYMCVVTGSNELDKEELPPKEEIPPEGAVMSLRSRSRSTDDGLTGNTPAVESPVFTLEVIRKDAIPQTGDSSRPAAWLALLGACCAGLWCVSRRRG